VHVIVVLTHKKEAQNFLATTGFSDCSGIRAAHAVGTGGIRDADAMRVLTHT